MFLDEAGSSAILQATVASIAALTPEKGLT